MELKQLKSVMSDLANKRLELEKQAQEFERLQSEIAELKRRAAADPQARAKVMRFERMMMDDSVRLQYDNLFSKTSDVQSKLSGICEQLRLLNDATETRSTLAKLNKPPQSKARMRTFV